jgi:hypothetical protein
MLCTYDVLQMLKHQHPNLNTRFVNLADDTDQLLDCRLNVFRHPAGRWAIAVEKLVDDQPTPGIILCKEKTRPL